MCCLHLLLWTTGSGRKHLLIFSCSILSFHYKRVSPIPYSLFLQFVFSSPLHTTSASIFPYLLFWFSTALSMTPLFSPPGHGVVFIAIRSTGRLSTILTRPVQGLVKKCSQPHDIQVRLAVFLRVTWRDELGKYCTKCWCLSMKKNAVWWIPLLSDWSMVRVSVGTVVNC